MNEGGTGRNLLWFPIVFFIIVNGGFISCYLLSLYYKKLKTKLPLISFLGVYKPAAFIFSWILIVASILKAVIMYFVSIFYYTYEIGGKLAFSPALGVLNGIFGAINALFLTGVGLFSYKTETRLHIMSFVIFVFASYSEMITLIILSINDLMTPLIRIARIVIISFNFALFPLFILCYYFTFRTQSKWHQMHPLSPTLNRHVKQMERDSQRDSVLKNNNKSIPMEDVNRDSPTPTPDSSVDPNLKVATPEVKKEEREVPLALKLAALCQYSIVFNGTVMVLTYLFELSFLSITD